MRTERAQILTSTSSHSPTRASALSPTTSTSIPSLLTETVLALVDTLVTIPPPFPSIHLILMSYHRPLQRNRNARLRPQSPLQVPSRRPGRQARQDRRHRQAPILPDAVPRPLPLHCQQHCGVLWQSLSCGPCCEWDEIELWQLYAAGWGGK